jgi:PhnB protein
MSITTTTHLNFHGTARAALDLYAEVFGGEVVARTYGDVGMPHDQPGADRIVFGQVVTADGFRVMAYDVPDRGDGAGDRPTTTTREHGMTLTDAPFFVALAGGSLAEVEAHWTGLAEGGTVIEPLAASAWSPGFGMLTDRFGVTWAISVDQAG